MCVFNVVSFLSIFLFLQYMKRAQSVLSEATNAKSRQIREWVRAYSEQSATVNSLCCFEAHVKVHTNIYTHTHTRCGNILQAETLCAHCHPTINTLSANIAFHPKRLNENLSDIVIRKLKNKNKIKTFNQPVWHLKRWTRSKKTNITKSQWNQMQ